MDVIDLLDFKEKLTGIRQQVEEMQKDIKFLEQRLASIQADNAAMLSLQKAVERVKQTLSGFGFLEKRLALRALEIRVVRVSKERLEISGRIPVETCPVTS